MKRVKQSLALLLVTLLVFGVQSCKKDKNSNETDDSASQIMHASDESNQNNEEENSLNDVNAVMENSGLGKSLSIAGATIDSVPAEKKIIITYNGNNSNNTRSRTGVVTIQLTSGTHWKDKDAVLTITFVNYKITRIANGKSITINGTHLITNVSGGLIRTLTSGNSVTHAINGNMVITFDDGTTRTWEITRQRVIAVDASGNATVTVSGTGTKLGMSNIAISGLNRAGGVFYTQISTPIVFASKCEWLPISGIKVHKALAHEITVTFGVDASGNTVTDTCPYGYKINWTNAKGLAKQAVISY